MENAPSADMACRVENTWKEEAADITRTWDDFARLEMNAV